MKSNAKDNMSQPRIRPRFQLSSVLSSEELSKRILEELDRKGCQFEGRVRKGYANIYFPLEVQHYWSPQLSLSFESQEDEDLVIRGLFGPRPAVWTMFVFFYSIIAFAIFLINIIGFSRYSLDLSSHLLWWNIPLILIFLSLYFIAFSGQRLGMDEMRKLKAFLDKILEDPSES